MEEKRVTSNTIISQGLMRLAADPKEQLNKNSVKGAEDATRLAILGNIPHSGADESHNTNNNRYPLTKLPSKKPKSTAANVVVSIQPGQPSPTQKQVWKRFWQKIIVEAKGMPHK